jgi:hypothetical protein
VANGLAYNGQGTSAAGLAGLPVWLRAIVLLGPTTAIALFLVWRSDRQGDEIAAISARLEAHAAVTTATAGVVLDAREESRSLISLLRQVCVNTSRTDDQRRECVR